MPEDIVRPKHTVIPPSIFLLLVAAILALVVTVWLGVPATQPAEPWVNPFSPVDVCAQVDAPAPCLEVSK